MGIYSEVLAVVKQQRESGKITKNQKFVLEEALRNKWKEEGKACERCGTKEEITVDHIVPDAILLMFYVDVNTFYDEENLAPNCRRCNQFKGSRMDFSDPRTKPLLIKYVNQIK